MTALRQKGIAADIYPSAAKMKKQFKYANERGIPFAGIIGSDELAQNKIALKNMESGDQELYDLNSLVSKLSQI